MARAATLALLSALVLAGCGVPTESDDRPLGEGDVPFALLADTTTTTSTTTTTMPAAVAAETFPIDVWWVRGDRLVAVRRDLRRRPQLDDLLDALTEGPAAEERRAGLRSALPPSVAVTAAEPVGGEIVVDVDPAFRDLSGPEQVLSLAQLVYTVTGLPGAGRVTFTIGGIPLDVPRADGLLVSGSVSRDDYASLVAALPGAPQGSLDAAVTTTAPAVAPAPAPPPSG